jgi:hypothetical protein
MPIIMDGVLKAISATVTISATVLSTWDAMPDGTDRVPTVSGLVEDLGFNL